MKGRIPYFRTFELVQQRWNHQIPLADALYVKENSPFPTSKMKMKELISSTPFGVRLLKLHNIYVHHPSSAMSKM